MIDNRGIVRSLMSKYIVCLSENITNLPIILKRLKNLKNNLRFVTESEKNSLTIFSNYIIINPKIFTRKFEKKVVVNISHPISDFQNVLFNLTL